MTRAATCLDVERRPVRSAHDAALPQLGVQDLALERQPQVAALVGHGVDLAVQLLKQHLLPPGLHHETASIAGQLGLAGDLAEGAGLQREREI